MRRHRRGRAAYAAGSTLLLVEDARLCRALLAVILISLLTPFRVLLWHRPATASKVKAAFSTTSRSLPSGRPTRWEGAQQLHLCVVGDNDVAQALEETIKGRKVEGPGTDRPGAHQRCRLPPQLPSALCRRAATRARSARLIDIAQGRARAERRQPRPFRGARRRGAADRGRVDRMRFAVNVNAAETGPPPPLSSKLLGLASIC